MTPLTPKQLQCLELVATGLPHKTIADRLGVSLQVVKDRCERVNHKLGARNSINAVYIAAKLGVLQ